MIPIRAALIFFPTFAIASQTAPIGGWRFDWSDEFNGPAVDATVWGHENGYVRNNEHQFYTNRTENSRIEGGDLLIQARRDNWNGHEYTSASLRTMGRKTFKYGRFEIRAKIDIRLGSWPAWWWLPNSGGWPEGGEVDMMEFQQGELLFNVMDGKSRWTGPKRAIASLGGPRWAEDFHIWTMEWDSTRIVLSLDGVVINNYPVNNANGTGPNGVNPFRQPGYLLLNQAIGGDSGGDPSGTSFPVDFRVDWLRVHVWDPGATGSVVTVKKGTGSGTYSVGTRASLSADQPPVGQVFDRWVVEAGGGTIDASGSPTAVLTVPSGNVTVAATYKPRDISGIRTHRALVLDARPGRLILRDMLGRKAPMRDVGAPGVHFLFGKEPESAWAVPSGQGL